MGLARFYCSRIEDTTVSLGRTETHHLVHVLRLGRGEQVEIFDGLGTIARVIITACSGSSVQFEVQTVTKHTQRTSGRVIIAAGMIKGQRFEWLVEKCTELGVDHIAAVLFEHSVRESKGSLAAGRYNKIAVSACKQCGRLFLPQITGPQNLETTVGQLMQTYPKAQMVFGSPNAASHNIENITAQTDLIAFIGPEGGLSKTEEQMLLERAAVPVGINENTLRTETAAVAFAAMACMKRP